MSAQSAYKAIGKTKAASATGAKPYKVFYNNNLGNRTFLMFLPIYDFYHLSEIASEFNVNVKKNPKLKAQRPLDTDHANKLANFILKGLVHVASEGKTSQYKKVLSLIGEQPYIALQPLVCNIRACERDGSDLKHRDLEVKNIAGSIEVAAHEVLLTQNHTLWVIDGQHRRYAIQLVYEFLSHILSTHKYPNKKAIYPVTSEDVSENELRLWQDCNDLARSECCIALEVHLGLNLKEERQLFHDLNNLGRRVETGLALEFDRGNPINMFIQDKLLGKILDWPVAHKDIVNWQKDDGSFTRKDLTSITTRLLLNKTNPRGATPAIVEKRLPLALRFWADVQKIPYLGKPGAKMKTVAAQPVVLKAIAKLAYDFSFGKEKDDDLINKFLKNLSKIDFTHKNPMWRYYQLSPGDRKTHKLEGLKDYLPPNNSGEKGYNRDIGTVDAAGTMRFGAKHNDIYPIIGDMIRWELGLPIRKHKKKKSD